MLGFRLKKDTDNGENTTSVAKNVTKEYLHYPKIFLLLRFIEIHAI